MPDTYRSAIWGFLARVPRKFGVKTRRMLRSERSILSLLHQPRRPPSLGLRPASFTARRPSATDAPTGASDSAIGGTAFRGG